MITRRHFLLEPSPRSLLTRNFALALLVLALTALAGCGEGSGEFTASTKCSEYNLGKSDSEKAAAREAWNTKVANKYGNFVNSTLSNLDQYCVQKPGATLDEATGGAVRGDSKKYSGIE